VHVFTTYAFFGRFTNFQIFFFYIKTFFGQIYMNIWSYGNTFWFISMLIKKKFMLKLSDLFVL